MKLNFGSETIMLLFILGLFYIMIIQPSYYSSFSSAIPGTPSPTPGGPTATPTVTPTPTNAAAKPAFFSLTPQTNSLASGETFTLAVTLNTGGVEIDAVELKLNFDPQFLQAVAVNPGAIFSQYTNREITTNQVKIYASGEIQNGQVVGFQGVGQYAQVVFRAASPANSTQVSFDQSSIAASAGNNKLDLPRCQPGNYQINN